MDQWEAALLSLLGAPNTPENISFLDGWAAAEGSAFNQTNAWNPFNVRNQSNGGFYGWSNPTQGLQGTANFIIDNGYSNILGALRSGSPANYPGLGSDMAYWSGHAGDSSALSASYQTLVGKGALGGSSSGGFGGGLWRLNPFDPNAWNPNSKGPSANPLQTIQQGIGYAGLFVVAGFLVVGGLIYMALSNDNTREAIVDTAKGATAA